ncbi:MAG: NADP oxidoreductase [Burkholderiaceae bacterium]|nr:NADP oxidoreductase [Microbacteriaceae bacterium]
MAARGGSLVAPADASATQGIAAQLPGGKVLKAFNTTFAATLFSGRVGSAPTTVLIAGDDAGALTRAGELEALGFLQLTLAVGEKIGWTGGFATITS